MVHSLSIYLSLFSNSTIKNKHLLRSLCVANSLICLRLSYTRNVKRQQKNPSIIINKYLIKIQRHHQQKKN